MKAHVMRLAWGIAEKLGKWPWEVRDEMPWEWFSFAIGLSNYQAEQAEQEQQKGRNKPQRRTMTGRTF